MPEPELSGPATPIEFTYGTGECPPADGVAEPVKTFTDPPQLCIDPATSYTATFVTDRGDIVVDLDTTHSPGTVNNFVTLARSGYYDDTTIFRTNTSIDIIQGGGLQNTDSPGYEIPDEGTGYEYPPGVLAMARTAAPDSAGGQWFFTTGADSASLSGAGTYVVFGAVTSGSDIAAEINALRRSGRRHADGDRHRPDGADHRELNRRGGAGDQPGGSSPCTAGSPTSSQPVAVRSRAVPVASSTMGVSDSDSVRLRRSSLHDSASGITATPCTSPSPSVNAPPRWSNIGSHRAAALSPTAATSPPVATTSSNALSTGESLRTLRRCIEESPTR